MKKLALMILMICSYSVFATDFGGDELRKTIKKEFKVQDNAKLEIENQRGSIECTTWDKDMVEIEVTIRVRGKDEAKVKEALDNIHVQFDASPTLISAETELGFSDFKSVQLKYNVDFVVKMPEDIDLEFENRFGDIYINKTSGDLDIELVHGDLRLGEAQRADMELKFGKASIGKIEKLDMDLHYMRLDIDEVDDLNLDSKFSEVDIENVNKLVLDSQSDFIEIDEAEIVLIDGQFSSLKVDKLNSVLDSDCSYGGITVKHVSPDFKSITSEHVFAGLKLVMDPDCAFTFDCNVSMGACNYPQGWGEISKEKLNYMNHSYSGVMGEGDPEGRVVNIEVSQGGVTIEKFLNQK